jgi:tetratricopeptide (TPR) repeat protein
LKQYDEAAKVFEKVVKLDPGLSDDYYNLGLCHFNQEKYDAALMTWLAALAHEPRNRSVNKGLAVLYWKRHEFQQAWDAVAKCQNMGIALDPDFLENLRKDSGVSGPEPQAPSRK